MKNAKASSLNIDTIREFNSEGVKMKTITLLTTLLIIGLLGCYRYKGKIVEDAQYLKCMEGDTSQALCHGKALKRQGCERTLKTCQHSQAQMLKKCNAGLIKAVTPVDKELCEMYALHTRNQCYKERHAEECGIHWTEVFEKID